MSLFEYNVRVIFVYLLCAAAVPILARAVIVEELKLELKKSSKIVVKICVILLTTFFVILMFINIAYKPEKIEKVEVVSILNQGSLGGLLDTYDIKVVDEEGEIRSYMSIVGASKDFLDSVEKINVGDIVDMKIVSFYGNFYHIVESG